MLGQPDVLLDGPNGSRLLCSTDPAGDPGVIGASGAVGMLGGGTGAAARRGALLRLRFGAASFATFRDLAADFRADFLGDRFRDTDRDELRRARFAETFLPRLLRRVVRRAFFFAAIAHPLSCPATQNAGAQGNHALVRFSTPI